MFEQHTRKRVKIRGEMLIITIWIVLVKSFFLSDNAVCYIYVSRSVSVYIQLYIFFISSILLSISSLKNESKYNTNANLLTIIIRILRRLNKALEMKEINYNTTGE